MKRLRGDAFQGRGEFRPDRLIAPLLNALWAAGIETRACCHGVITTPYVSMADSAASRRFLAKVACWIWMLLLPWATIEGDYEGQQWISLSAPNWKRLFLPAGRRHYRKALAWDVLILRFLANRSGKEI